MLEGSKEIYERALEIYKPKTVVVMLSGGDDSMTAYTVARELGISYDAVIHGNTGTGIRQTNIFAENEVKKRGDRLLVANAGDAYERYVLRKGFFGKGITAHSYAYHILKAEPFRKVVSKHLRQRRRNYKVLFLNGARRQESPNRQKNMVEPYRADGNNIWVNLIHNWSKQDCLDYMNDRNICRNPVSKKLCRSGECMCGTMQAPESRAEASYLYPEWGEWLDNLESKVIQKFPWKWGQNISKQKIMEMHGQMTIDFMPMCHDCRIGT
jgi:3'-phosphoadenosine 5'-phosphosulfate sulfotransferase (PAPS reductase)/FAD synthetase